MEPNMHGIAWCNGGASSLSPPSHVIDVIDSFASCTIGGCRGKHLGVYF